MTVAPVRLPAVELPPGCPAQVERAVEILRGSSIPVSADALARRVATSKFHLSRLFVAVLGAPPGRLHRQLRLRRGAELLLLGLAPCDVALELGFSDQAHVTRQFHKLVGLPPGRYARSRAVATELKRS